MKIGVKIGAGFALGLAMIALLGVTSYESALRQFETNRRVTHTYRVLEELENALSVLQDAESGQMGFILTGEDSYLAPYEAAKILIWKSLEALSALTADDPTQQVSIRQIRSLTEAEISELAETIHLRKEGGLPLALPVILTDRGKRLMDGIRTVGGHMKDRETLLLQQQTESANASARRTTWIILLGAPLSLLVLAVAAFILTRNIAPPLAAMARVARRISEGELSVPLPRTSRRDEVGVLQESFERMSAWLGRMRDSARRIAGRDLATSIEPQSERDELGIAFSAMVENLREMTGALREQGQELLRQNEELTQKSEELSQQSEELAHQNEELRLQSEEIQALNSELAGREKTLQRLLESVRSLLGEQQAVDAICTSALEIFGESADTAVVMELEGGRLVVRAQAGISGAGSQASARIQDCSFARLVVTHNKTAALDDASLRPDIKLLPVQDGAAFKSVIASPLIVQAACGGAVAIYSRHEQKWTEDQFRLSEWLAAQCSLALEIVRLQIDLRSQMALMDLSPDGIMGRRIDGSITRWGHGAEVLYGWTKDEARGKNSHALLKTRFPQPLEQIVGQLEQTGKWSGSVIHTTKGGRTVAVQSRWLAQRGASGEIVELLESNVDITERQIAEEALRQAAEQRRLALEAADLGAWDYQFDTGDVFWDNRCRAMWGVQEGGHIQYKDAIAGIHPQDRPAIDEAVKQALAGVHGGAYHREFRVVWPDGTVHWIASHGRVYFEGDAGQRKAVRFIGVTLDISERKQQEEALERSAAELRRSNQELEQFAYVTSHDLQEPLRQVRSFVQLLRDRHLDRLEGKAAEYMQFIVDGTVRMSNLVQDLLTYSRVGPRETRAEATSCLTVLNSALANLQGSIREAGARITHDNLPTLKVDPVQLTQLFQNLVGNAVKFRRQDVPPEIHVGARRERTAWLLSVQDNGIGIDSEHFNRIFLIFQRLHGREKYSGTGIGLAICRKIVEQYGGRIWVESQVGAGTTFYFTLPGEDIA